MLRWKQAKLSMPGDVEVDIKIPNPVEPEDPLRLRLVIFGPRVGETRKEWRAHATFAGTELFRLYAPTLPEAKERTERGLREIFGQLIAVVAS